MSFALLVAILLSKLALVLGEKNNKSPLYSCQFLTFENANFYILSHAAFTVSSVIFKLKVFDEYINTNLQFPLMLIITFWASTADEARARTSTKPA